MPRLEITLDSQVAGISAAALVARLWDDTPRVAVLPGLANRVYVTPDTLVNGEAMMVMERIRTVLCSARDEL